MESQPDTTQKSKKQDGEKDDVVKLRLFDLTNVLENRRYEHKKTQPNLKSLLDD